jgi:hypothetical protein
LCEACSRKYPFRYSPAKTCLEGCDKYTYPANHKDVAKQGKTFGLYRINPSTCGECGGDCVACSGDKFNCTKCDASQKRALFQQEMTVGGKPTVQGTCAK